VAATVVGSSGDGARQRQGAAEQGAMVVEIWRAAGCGLSWSGAEKRRRRFEHGLEGDVRL
jgi:hypothetical protein